MANPPRVNRLQKENFNKDDHELVESLATSLNPFMEQTRNALDGRLGFDNLNQELITFQVTVDVDGTPYPDVQWKSGLLSQVAGCHVISAISSPTVFPDGAPFLTFTQNGDIVSVLHITGLPADTRYRLTVLAIGR